MSGSLPPLGRASVAAALLATLGVAPAALAAPPATPATREPVREPVLASEPVVMREPGEPMVLPDAADERDPFDIELQLGYRFSFEGGLLTRGEQAAAAYERFSSLLTPEVRVGMFRDLAGFVRLPVLLAETNEIGKRAGGGESISFQGETLVSFPFASPARSGLKSFATGFAYGLMNQARDPSLPSWNIGLEAEVSIGDPIRACVKRPVEGELACADAADVNRNGVRDAGEPALESGLESGLTRESLTLRLESKLSRRIRFVEPFAGVGAAVELPFANSPLLREGAFTLPPVHARAELGVGFLPWENRERHSRVWLDVRVRATFVSQGPDISPAFDLAGASSALALRQPVTVGSQQGVLNGVLTSEAHARIGGLTSFIWRASQIIRFGVDVELEHATAHSVASELSCSESPGSCDDLHYREALHRDDVELGVSSSVSFGLGASGAVMF